MPRKPKHPCSHPGCPELVEYGERYCERHLKEENKRYEKYDRNPAVRRRYGRAWKRIRDSYAAANPLCELCLDRDEHGRLYYEYTLSDDDAPQIKKTILKPSEVLHIRSPALRASNTPSAGNRS